MRCSLFRAWIGPSHWKLLAEVPQGLESGLCRAGTERRIYPLALRVAKRPNNSIGVPAEIGAFNACQKQAPRDRKRLHDFAFTPNTAPQNAPQPAGTVCGKGRDRGARPEIARTIARRQQFDIGGFWPDNYSPESAPRP